MKSKGQRLLAKALVPAFGLFLLVPTVATAQSSTWWGRNNQSTQRRDRRQDRREDRRDRREDRRDDRRDDSRGRNWDRYGNYGGSSQLRQTALNAGYNEGIKEGRNDRSRGERPNYTDESDYRSASKDYSSRLGDRGMYQRYFREGFANGYNDGYRGY
jgi:hypothetical protein